MRNEKNTPLFVFKYGGNAMVNDRLKDQILQAICSLHDQGNHVLIVHGGGPFIQRALDRAEITSEFIDGQRKTSAEAMKEVETALKGEVNSDLVGRINAMGYKAVGLSGKDGQTVVGEKRRHVQRLENGEEREIDLGRVGNVLRVEPQLLEDLIQSGYIPVMTCIAQDAEGNSLNINGDIFAGHIAGHLNAKSFVVLTDIDGLLRDINDPASIIQDLALAEIDSLIHQDVIQGGMIPKIEACTTAVRLGASAAYILNGTKPDQLTALTTGGQIGTKITYGTQDK